MLRTWLGLFGVRSVTAMASASELHLCEVTGSLPARWLAVA